MKKVFSLVFIFFTITSSVISQNENNKIIISGFVKDSLNIPMKGVSIFIDDINSKKRAKTNSNGYFKIRSKQFPEKIIARSSYYGTEEVRYQNKNTVMIIFEKVKWRSDQNITNFISEINTSKKRRQEKDENKKYFSNMLDYLDSQPGIFIHERSNGSGVIRINGHGNTISQFNNPEFGDPPSPEPLFVIDGIIVNKNKVLSLHPNEVDSVTVLRHGDAAFYGLQGGNGVIKIRTKRG